MAGSKPYKFQKVGVKLIQKFKGRALLADAMGLGKTFQSLLWAWMYLPDDEPIVVVCPATIKENWKREAAKHLGMRAEVLYGRKPPAKYVKRMRSNAIYVINYDILGNVRGSSKTWNKFLKKVKPRLVIVDECHYISNPGAKRTQWVKQLCNKVKHVIAISGTPMTNRPAELWAILNLLWPKKFPSFIRFGQRYCKPEVTPWGVKYRGAVRLKELHRKLKEAGMIRRLKEDVLKDLPPKQTVVQTIKLEPKAMKEYTAAESDFIGWLRKTHPNKANKARKAERLVRYGYLLRLAADLKMKYVHEWIDSFLKESDEKLIVFGVHKKVVKGLNERYAKISVRIDGSTPKHLRMGIVDEFLNKDSNRLIFGNLMAAGTGWSAPGVTNTLHTELGWRPGDHDQADERTHGINRGRKGEVSTGYYLITEGTIEGDLAKLLQKKRKDIRAVMDGKRESSGSLDIYDQLERKMLKRAKLLRRK